MQDLLTAGLNFIANQITEGGKEVTYRRGMHSFAIKAVIGKTAFQVASSNNTVVEHESRDYIVAAAGLVLNGESIEPQRGDQILETMGTKTFCYEVMRPDGGEQPFRADPQRITFRIHTKFVGEE